MKQLMSESSHPLSKQRGISLYYQVEELIRSRIQNGDWSTGDKLPSEPELAQQLNVSRATVRQAILELSQKGMLERKHGSGTYVARPSFKTDFVAFSYPPEMGDQHKLIYYSQQPCDASIAEHLKIPEGTNIVIACLLRLFNDGRTAGMETVYIKQEYDVYFAKEILQGLNHEYIQKNANIDFTRVETKLKPVLVGEREAELMGEAPGVPALMITKTYYTYNDCPVYHLKNVICEEACEYLIITPGSSSSASSAYSRTK